MTEHHAEQEAELFASLKQGSEEWAKARAGYATASNFSDILSKPKTGHGESTSRRNYRTQLVTERLTGLPAETYQNAHMQWGTATEPLARDALEVNEGLLVRTVGFLKHPVMAWTGASPDGLVGEDATVQLKCPSVSTNHIETLEFGMPPKYKAQVQGELWVTGRAYSYFVSFDPRMPSHLRLHVEKIHRDEDYISLLNKEVKIFLAEVDEMHQRLLKK